MKQMLRLTLLAAFVALTMAHAARAADSREAEVKQALEFFLKADPELKKFFDGAAGYAAFPSVGKGAVGIGAAHGTGLVYEKGKLIGAASLTQLTIGFQLGGQSYSELIFFESKDALNAFKESKFALSAQVSAVAAASGASANAKYQQGAVVFTLAKGGLMYEASVGGQKFKFTPVHE